MRRSIPALSRALALARLALTPALSRALALARLALTPALSRKREREKDLVPSPGMWIAGEG
jgi:hypothetical protein